MTHVTCRLTAKNRNQLRNPTLSNRVWAIFTFFTMVCWTYTGGLCKNGWTDRDAACVLNSWTAILLAQITTNFSLLIACENDHVLYDTVYALACRYTRWHLRVTFVVSAISYACNFKPKLYTHIWNLYLHIHRVSSYMENMLLQTQQPRDLNAFKMSDQRNNNRRGSLASDQSNETDRCQAPQSDKRWDNCRYHAVVSRSVCWPGQCSLKLARSDFSQLPLA